MAAWLAPALKAVLPHLGTIVSAVAPVFTRKKSEPSANQVQLLQEQIAELQTAASQNNAYIKDLAEQLQTTVAALEQTASIAEAKTRLAIIISVAAMALSVGVALLIFVLLPQ